MLDVVLPLVAAMDLTFFPEPSPYLQASISPRLRPLLQAKRNYMRFRDDSDAPKLPLPKLRHRDVLRTLLRKLLR